MSNSLAGVVCSLLGLALALDALLDLLLGLGCIFCSTCLLLACDVAVLYLLLLRYFSDEYIPPRSLRPPPKPTAKPLLPAAPILSFPI